MKEKIINMDKVFNCISGIEEKGIKQAEIGLQNIKNVLFDSYVLPQYVARKKSVGLEERRSLANKELYDLILKEKRLPTVEEYTEAYLNHNSHFIDLPHEAFLANLAYRSLVADLYFYFVLLKSGRFTNVEVKYIYDIYAQTDVFLTLDKHVLGVQLYAGSDIQLKNQRLQEMHNNLDRSYPIYLLAMEENKTQREMFITKNGDEILLYGQKDAEMLYSLMIKGRETSQSIVIREKMEQEAKNADVDYFEFKRSPQKATSNNNVYEEYLAKVNHSLLILGNDQIAKVSNKFKQEAKKKGITLHLLDIDKRYLPNNMSASPIVIDGEIDEVSLEKLKSIGKNANCNIFQYEVEHFSPNDDLIISAGAGSGKTHTLISRTLFLLDKGYVQNLNEIAMITFTKEAANNMRKELAKRFIKLYLDTNEARYRLYLEELQGMQISTIPAFAKHILQKFSHHLGLGSQIDISNLTMQKREVIENELDDTVKTIDPNLTSFKEIRQYDLLNLIESIWEKIEQKGVGPKTIKVSDKEEDKLYQIILQTLQKAEVKLDKEKFDKNTISLADLTRLLKKLIKEEAPLDQLGNYYKYLFIDEFQDTDNAQIDFIAEIALQSKIPLLVVGDIKQSIYRFRGATATAFDMLEDKLTAEKRKVKRTSLLHNYRTASPLLERMEKRFEIWRRNEWLPQNEEAMLPKFEQPTHFNDYYEVFPNEINSNEIYKRFGEMPERSNRKKDEFNVMAILVRRNSEANEVGEVLKQISQSKKDEQFVFDVQLEGTLYESKAAKDLLILLESWLKPRNKSTLFALSETPYCQQTGQVISLVDDGIYKLNIDTLPIRLPAAWHEAIQQMKFNPILLVINEFLTQVPYVTNLAKINNVPLDHFSLKKYQLNLYKILMQMYATVGDDYVDLLTIYNWLKIQVATNREDDEAELTAADVSKKMIKVMTVHKSKGLEFHTVLIPYTNNSFLGKKVNVPSSPNEGFDYRQFDFFVKKGILKPYKNIIVHFKNKIPYIDWLFVRYNENYKFYHVTKNYEKVVLDENEETVCEETRILYVAMTRAEERLFIYGTEARKGKASDVPNCWADLLNK